MILTSLLSPYPVAYALAPASVIIPGRPVTVEGMVVDKYIGEGGNLTLHFGIWNTVSIRLTGTDPVNQVRPGSSFAYIVSKADFEKVTVGSHVRANVWTLHAKIVRMDQ